MATSGMDPAFGQALTALTAGVSGLPESYAAGQKHLLAQQIAQFNQLDKDRNFNLNKPLKEAQTRHFAAKADEGEQKNLANSLFPELSRKLLVPVRGMNGEPDRIAFNDDPRVMADVISNLSQRGVNAEQTINAFRSGMAGHLAAAPKPGSSMPSPNGQIAAGRIGKDMPTNVSSVFSVQDRDAVNAEKERQAGVRVDKTQSGALARAELASKTSKENAVLAQAGQDARTAATLKNRQEIEAARAGRAGASGAGSRISAELVNLVEGKNPGGLDGFANVDVDPIVPIKKDESSTDYTARVAPIKRVYADKFYEVYRSTNPPDAAKARSAARAAASAAMTGGTTTAAPSESPAEAIAPGATAPAATLAEPAAVTPAARTAAPSFSNPSQNIIDARHDQIAASYGMTREELRSIASGQGMSVEDYIAAVNTPAQEVPVEPERPDLINPEIANTVGRSDFNTYRTPDTVPNNGSGIIPAADRLVEATTPPSTVVDQRRGHEPESYQDLSAQVTPGQQAKLDQLQTPAAVVAGQPAAVQPAAPVATTAATAPAAAPEAKPAPAAAKATTPAEGGPADFLAGTNRGGLNPNAYFKNDAKTQVAPGYEYGNTYETAFKSTDVNNSDALMLSAAQEALYKPQNNLGMPKESFGEPKQYKPSDYLYKPDAVEQIMSESGIDRKTAFGRRVEQLHREKYSLMNSLASMSGPGAELNGAMREITERLRTINQKIDATVNNPYAKISPSAALITEDFVNAPGLVVNSLSDVPEQNRKYVLKQAEVLHLLNTFTNVRPNSDGSFAVSYPMPVKDTQPGLASRVYATEVPEGTVSQNYIEGDKMFAAFDRAHADIQRIFIRDGKLGMKPGDSLARTLVTLKIKSNMEIAQSGKAGLLDESAKPANWFQGLIQYPFK